MERKQFSEDTATEIAAHVSYDPDTGLFHCIRAWHRKSVGDVIGVDNGNGYMRMQLFGVMEYAHRLAVWFMCGYLPNYVDHINGDGKDNRWCNLRECTQSENMRSQNWKRSGRTLPRGVYKHMLVDKYVAAITCNYVTTYIGIYNTVEQAREAYQETWTKNEFRKIPLPK